MEGPGAPFLFERHRSACGRQRGVLGSGGKQRGAEEVGEGKRMARSRKRVGQEGGGFVTGLVGGEIIAASEQSGP